MSKFDMSASGRKRTPVPAGENTPAAPPQDTPPKKADTPKAGKSAEILSPKNITTTLEIAKIIVEGQAEIAKIRAKTEAEVQKIEAEIKKIIVTTQGEVFKMQAENQNWHSRFDARQQAIQKTIAILESHPEYSDEVKKMIIQLTIAGLEKQ